jgi:hypothetical protein
MEIGLGAQTQELARDIGIFYVHVKNTGQMEAEDVIALINVKGAWNDYVPIGIIEWKVIHKLTLRSPRPSQLEGRTVENLLARAFVRERAEKSFTLSGDSLPFRFALFFTVKGSDKVYFPSNEIPPINLSKFDIDLMFQPKGARHSHGRAYRISIKNWNSISVRSGKPDAST